MQSGSNTGSGTFWPSNKMHDAIPWPSIRKPDATFHHLFVPYNNGHTKPSLSRISHYLQEQLLIILYLALIKIFMIKKTFILIGLLCLNSCLPSKKNNEYAQDFKTMNKIDFSKKYFTLYNENNIDFSRIKKNKAYYILRNGSTFQIVVFSEDKFIYETPLMNLTMLEKPFAPIKLGRSSYFLVINNQLKTESKAATLGSSYSIIEEGEIEEDTIFMKKKYNSRGAKNEHKLFDKYILFPEIIVYMMGNDYFIERKN
nr:hypothetical protein [uncultured Flavobacterium sp.]